jgi:hypothetical protein
MSLELTKVHETAAALIAEGELEHVQICKQIGVCTRTLRRWKQEPEFLARVDAILEAYRAEIRCRSIAVVERRVEALIKRWERLNQIIADRAADPAMEHVPGGKTGLLVRRAVYGVYGDKTTRFEYYLLDVSLLRELREHEKQVAIELGQWGLKAGPVQVTKAYINIEADDV